MLSSHTYKCLECILVISIDGMIGKYFLEEAPHSFSILNQDQSIDTRKSDFLFTPKGQIGTEIINILRSKYTKKSECYISSQDDNDDVKPTAKGNEDCSIMNTNGDDEYDIDEENMFFFIVFHGFDTYIPSTMYEIKLPYDQDKIDWNALHLIRLKSHGFNDMIFHDSTFDLYWHVNKTFNDDTFNVVPIFIRISNTSSVV